MIRRLFGSVFVVVVYGNRVFWLEIVSLMRLGSLL